MRLQETKGTGDTPDPGYTLKSTTRGAIYFILYSTMSCKRSAPKAQSTHNWVKSQISAIKRAWWPRWAQQTFAAPPRIFSGICCITVGGPVISDCQPTGARFIHACSHVCSLLLPCLALSPYLCRWTHVVLGASRPFCSPAPRYGRVGQRTRAAVSKAALSFERRVGQSSRAKAGYRNGGRSRSADIVAELSP